MELGIYSDNRSYSLFLVKLFALNVSCIYVITGGPGFGKSSIISRLKQKGFTTGNEVAREIINEQMECQGEILPWKNSKLFQQEVLRRRILFFKNVNRNEIAFSDRGIPDQIAFARYKGFGTPPKLLEKARESNYAKTVFITPPWIDIYTRDEVRTESFDEACIIHDEVEKIYKELEYSLVYLPFDSVEMRINYILNQIKY